MIFLVLMERFSAIFISENHCYKLFGVAETDRKNYEDSEKTCTAADMKSHVTSIADVYEQGYFTEIPTDKS